MPQTRSTRSRVCKDLSSTQVQCHIVFPAKKKSSNLTVKKKPLIKKSSIKEKVVKFQDENEDPTKLTVKRKASVSDENICSPKKSPRKSLGEVKSPLTDRTNVSGNVNIELSVPNVGVRRKLPLSEANLHSNYSNLCQVLHNSIPKKLLNRDDELKVLKEFVHDSIIDSKPGSLYICGAPGTGKTACLTKVLDGVREKIKAKTIFLNCMTLRHSQTIFAKLANLLDSAGKSFTNSEGLKYIEKKIKSNGQRILLVLDEIDQLESKDQDVLYKLFEMPFVPKSKLVLVGIANSLDFTDRVLPRLQTKTCKPILLQFQPYRKDDICAILQERIDEKYANIVEASAIQFCARKVSAMTGDARKALDIMRRAVEKAEGQSKKSTDDSIIKVTIGHVASVCSDVYGAKLAPSSNVKFVFPLQQKIIICVVVGCLKQSRIKEIAVSRLYQAYCRVSYSKHLTPVSQEELNSICDLLESQGVISVKKSKDVRNHKIGLRMQESEIEHSLQDKSLMLSIMEEKLIS